MQGVVHGSTHPNADLSWMLMCSYAGSQLVVDLLMRMSRLLCCDAHCKRIDLLMHAAAVMTFGQPLPCTLVYWCQANCQDDIT